MIFGSLLERTRICTGTFINSASGADSDRNRRSQRRHVTNDMACKLAGTDLGCPLHQALEIVRNFFLLDGALDSAFDQVGGFVPSQVTEHHHAAEHDGAGIDYVFVSVLGGGAVGGFEDGVSVADVGAGGDAE